MNQLCSDKRCPRYGQELDDDGICRGKSIRKPHNQDAGYIASLRSGINKGWVVIYYAKEADFDDRDGKYAVVCQTHNTIVNTTSLPKARAAMKAVDFCEECTGWAVECDNCHKTHNARGYGNIHECPNCLMVRDFTKQMKRYRGDSQ